MSLSKHFDRIQENVQNGKAPRTWLTIDFEYINDLLAARTLLLVHVKTNICYPALLHTLHYSQTFGVVESTTGIPVVNMLLGEIHAWINAQIARKILISVQNFFVLVFTLFDSVENRSETWCSLDATLHLFYFFSMTVELTRKIQIPESMSCRCFLQETTNAILYYGFLWK